MPVNWKQARKKAATTARWAVTMTKVRIRRVAARTRWQLVTFCGAAGGESVGVVDLLAVRKDHRNLGAGLKRGDALQIVLIQVKGGQAAMPSDQDRERLVAVARRHHAHAVLLAQWKRGEAVRFFHLQGFLPDGPIGDWSEVPDLSHVFR